MVAARRAAASSDEEEDDVYNAVEVTDDNREGNPPLTSVVCALRPNVAVRVLEHHVGW